MRAVDPNGAVGARETETGKFVVEDGAHHCERDCAAEGDAEVDHGHCAGDLVGPDAGYVEGFGHEAETGSCREIKRSAGDCPEKGRREKDVERKAEEVKVETYQHLSSPSYRQ